MFLEAMPQGCFAGDGERNSDINCIIGLENYFTIKVCCDNIDIDVLQRIKVRQFIYYSLIREEADQILINYFNVFKFILKILLYKLKILILATIFFKKGMTSAKNYSLCTIIH